MKQKAQDNILNLIKDILTKEKRVVDFLGYKIIIHKKVYAPDSIFSFTTKVIAESINPGSDDVILDAGTGTGVLAIISVKKGAKRAVAIDIDDNCIKNAKENVGFHKLGNVEIRKSDLFDNIKPQEQFDIITANLPMTDANYNTPIKHFLFDPEYKIHDRFLKNAKSHLTKKGIILIPSGDVANEKKLLGLIKKYDYETTKVTQRKFQGITFKLYQLKQKD
jgi:methylase of polypeptide subunit release factors